MGSMLMGTSYAGELVPGARRDLTSLSSSELASTALFGLGIRILSPMIGFRKRRIPTNHC